MVKILLSILFIIMPVSAEIQLSLHKEKESTTLFIAKLSAEGNESIFIYNSNINYGIQLLTVYLFDGSGAKITLQKEIGDVLGRPLSIAEIKKNKPFEFEINLKDYASSIPEGLKLGVASKLLVEYNAFQVLPEFKNEYI